MPKVKIMFCSKCGAQIPENSNFCGNCGQRFEVPVNNQTPANTAVPSDNTYTAYPDPNATPIPNSYEAYPQNNAVPAENSYAEYSQPNASPNPENYANFQNPTAYADANAYSAQETTVLSQQQQPYYNPMGSAPFAQPAPTPPARKKSKLPLILGAGAVVIALLAVVFLVNIKGLFIKVFGSDEDYLQYVDEKAATEYVDQLSALYGNAIDTAFHTDGGKTEINLTITDEAHELIGKYVDMDLEWLRDITLTLDGSKDNGLMQAVAALELSGKEIVDLACILDLENEMTFITLSNLTEKYLGAETSFGEEASILYDEKFAKLFPSESEVNTLLTKYVGIVIENLDNVSKSSETIKVDGIEQKVTKLTLKVDNETLTEIAEDILEEVKKDKIIKNLILDFAKYGIEKGYQDVEPNEAYETFVNEVNGTLEMLNEEEYENETLFNLITYVDNSHEIVGLKIKKDKTVYFSSETATKGKNYATCVEYNGLVLEGKGTKSGDKITGDYVVVIEETPIFEFSLSDFDTKSILEGKAKGKIKIELTNALLEAADVPSEARAIIDMLDLGLIINLDCDSKSGKSQITFFAKEEAMFVLDLNYSYGGGSSVKVPKDNDVINSEDAEEWAETIDLDKLIENLKKAGLPEEITDLIEDGAGSLI